MSLFSNLTTNGLEKDKDVIGGGFTPFDSNIYTATLKAVYAVPSQSGAMGVTILADVDGREYRETVYVTNKKGENFFTTKNGKKSPLPGFTLINDLCLIACEKPLNEIDTQDKVLNIYSYEAKKEVPQSVPVLIDLVDKKVALAILHELRNKQAKNDSTGAYEDTAETRNVNTIVKVLHPITHQTVNEAMEEKEASFWDAWIKKYATGNPVDKRTIKDGGNAGTSGRPQKPVASAATPTPRKSLFG